MRRATQTDAAAIGRLIFDCVRSGPSPYTQAQRAAWMPEPRSGADWEDRLSAQIIILHERASELQGMMSLLPATGYIDFAFILPGARGQGLFQKLYDEIEQEARLAGLNRLWVHASLMAEPAFSRIGFQQLAWEDVEIGNEKLKRCLMDKSLPPST